MTKEELALLLNGREYRNEMTPDMVEDAKKSNLVAIYWYSDDWVELNWAIVDEVWAWEWTEFHIRWEEIINLEEIDETLKNLDSDTDYISWLVKKDLESSKVIKAEYDNNDESFLWIIKTEYPHSTFEIKEDWDNFCKWIVLDLNEIE